jgi:uncharacterized protein
VEVFLDTGYLIALEDADDQDHEAAREHWRELPTPPALTTTTYVFDEVVTFFNSRGHHRKAIEIGEVLLTSPSVRLMQVDEDLFRRGFDYLDRHQDKRYSLTDCISFVVMAERELATAFTFDQHFVQAGFVKEP